jgi:hypothetical protein
LRHKFGADDLFGLGLGERSKARCLSDALRYCGAPFGDGTKPKAPVLR